MTITPTPRVALTIAGSDSGGGAGLQADLRTFSAHRLHGCSAVTAVTAQNSVGVTAWAAIDPALVVAKIEAVAEAARRFKLGPLVVMVEKSGHRLLDEAAERASVSTLFPRATPVTPNLHEVEALLGWPATDLNGMRRAAKAYVVEALRRSYSVGTGRGPLQHLHPLL